MFSWTRRPGWYRAQGYEARTTCAVNVETPTPMQAPSTQPPYEPLPPAPRRSPRLYDLAPICLAVALAGLFSEWLLYRMGLT